MRISLKYLVAGWVREIVPRHKSFLAMNHGGDPFLLQYVWVDVPVHTLINHPFLKQHQMELMSDDFWRSPTISGTRRCLPKKQLQSNLCVSLERVLFFIYQGIF